MTQQRKPLDSELTLDDVEELTGVRIPGERPLWGGCLVATPNADYAHAIGDFDRRTKCGLDLYVTHARTLLVKGSRRFRMCERYEARQELCPRCRIELESRRAA